MLQPAPGDATSGGEGCYNRQVFLLEPTKGSVADFFLAGTSVLFCYYRRLHLLLPATTFFCDIIHEDDATSTTGDNIFLLQTMKFFATTGYRVCYHHTQRPAGIFLLCFATTTSFFCCNRQPQKLHTVNIFATMTTAGCSGKLFCWKR